MSKNTDAGLNMIETLKAMYPNLPVYEIYAHFVYILAMFDDNSKSFIKNTINIFRKSQYSLFSQEENHRKNKLIIKIISVLWESYIEILCKLKIKLHIMNLRKYLYLL